MFLRVAQDHHAPITFADQHYVVDDVSRYTTELTGEYQKKNIVTVLEAVEVLRKSGQLPVTSDQLRRGLARVVTNTHLQGRWQKIGERPLTICETAHNEPGIRAMLQGIANTPHRNLHLVYGCVNDKDFRHILQYLNSELRTSNFELRTPNSELRTPNSVVSPASLSSELTWYFSQPSVPRGVPVVDLVEAAKGLGINGEAYKDVKDAIAAARSAADPADLVLVTGSIFLIADALNNTSN